MWDDQHLWFVDIASPGTVANLKANRWVEINVVDPISRTGYRFRGRATVHRDGPTYDEGLARMAARGSTTPPDRVRSIVLVEIDEADSLSSPAYDTDPDPVELMGRWLRHHAGLHPEAGPPAGGG